MGGENLEVGVITLLHTHAYSMHRVDSSFQATRMYFGEQNFHKEARLAHACVRFNTKATIPGWGLFAMDRNETGSKYFVVASWQALWRLIFSRKALKPNAYEVIRHETPCRMYFDVDMAVPDAPDFPGGPFTWTEDQQSWFASFLLDTLAEFLTLGFNRLVPVRVVQSCSATKFSLHIICEDLFVDSNVASGRTLAHYFSVYLTDVMTQMLTSNCVEEYQRLMLDRALDYHIIDDSVYSRNRCFRLIGQCKLGSDRVLIPYVPAEGVKWCKDYDVSQTDMLDYAVTMPPTIDTVVVSIPCPKYLKSRYCRALDLGEGTLCEGLASRCEALYAVMVEKPLDVQVANRKRMVPAYQRADEGFDRASKSKSNSVYNLDGDEEVYTGSGNLVSSESVVDGGHYYCPVCETKTNKATAGRWERWKPTGVIGESSAIGFKHKTTNRLVSERKHGLFCFGCGNTTFIYSTASHTGVKASADETIPIAQYLSPESCGMKLPKTHIFIDAPMGKGKTTAVKEYANTTMREARRILVISFRVALCRFLRAQLNEGSTHHKFALYQDSNLFPIWKEHAENNRGGPIPMACVICVDSMRKIPELDREEPFDLVVIDECVFTMNQVATSELRTSKERVENLKALSSVLQNARKALYLQHCIPEVCIQFYQGLAKSTEYALRKMNDTVSLMPVKYEISEDSRGMQLRMLHFFLEHLRADGTGSDKPFVIFTNNKGLSGELSELLRRLPEKYLPNNYKPRVLLINSATALMQEQKAFIANPTANGCNWDVVICTPSLQAGISITERFVTSFEFLFSGVMKYRDELQLVSRLRVRNGLEPFKFAWLQPGRTGRFDCSRAQESVMIYAGFEDHYPKLGAPVDHSHEIAKVAAHDLCEYYDSTNRHAYLHVREYRNSNVEHHRLTGLPIVDTDRYPGLEYICETRKVLRKNVNEIIVHSLVCTKDGCHETCTPNEQILNSIGDTGLTGVVARTQFVKMRLLSLDADQRGERSRVIARLLDGPLKLLYHKLNMDMTAVYNRCGRMKRLLRAWQFVRSLSVEEWVDLKAQGRDWPPERLSPIINQNKPYHHFHYLFVLELCEACGLLSFQSGLELRGEKKCVLGDFLRPERKLVFTMWHKWGEPAMGGITEEAVNFNRDSDDKICVGVIREALKWCSLSASIKETATVNAQFFVDSCCFIVALETCEPSESLLALMSELFGGRCMLDRVLNRYATLAEADTPEFDGVSHPMIAYFKDADRQHSQNTANDGHLPTPPDSFALSSSPNSALSSSSPSESTLPSSPPRGRKRRRLEASSIPDSLA